MPTVPPIKTSTRLNPEPVLILGVLYLALFHAHNILTVLPLPVLFRGWKEVAQMISIPYFLVWAIQRNTSTHITLAGMYCVLMLVAMPAFRFDMLILSMSGSLMLFGHAGLAALLVDGLQESRARGIIHASAAVLAVAMIGWLPIEEQLGLGAMFDLTYDTGGVSLMLRDSYLRARFVFDSPLDASQASWFLGVLLCWLGVFHTRSILVRWLSIGVGVGVLMASVFTYTRAGLFLALISITVVSLLAAMTGRRLGGLVVGVGVMASIGGGDLDGFASRL